METPNVSMKGSFTNEIGTPSNWIMEPGMSGPLRCASFQSASFNRRVTSGVLASEIATNQDGGLCSRFGGHQSTRQPLKSTCTAGNHRAFEIVLKIILAVRGG
jgi:hypothetical protein